MKRLVLIISIFFLVSAYAQDGFKSINLGYGYDLKQRQQFFISFEKNYKYYNSWEAYFNLTREENIFSFENVTVNGLTYRNQKIKTYEELKWGLAYKPLLLKHKDFLLNFRAGGFMGTNYDRIIFGPDLGFDAKMYITNFLLVGFIQSNQMVFNSNDKFRHSLFLNVAFQF